MSQSKEQNRLGTEKINKLLYQFAIPSIISMLVGSLYNIVDQFFIGRSVGGLGNAATNIAFPLTISCLAIALMFGVGGSSAFNISMGKGDRERAGYVMGNALVVLVGAGLLLSLITWTFLDPLLHFFGAPKDVFGYAKTYTKITSFGFPFLILTTGGGHFIRADGRPKITMFCNMIGAIINMILDALFVFVMNLGIAGAALATVIGQFVSALFVIYYLLNCKSIKLKKCYFKLKGSIVLKVAVLGGAPCCNQFAMMIIQIVMNKSLKYYGGLSIYGEAIPIACSGIIAKVNMLFMSFVIGISQGLQPIASYNYGAKNYKRVKDGYYKATIYGSMVAVIAFLIFQFFPRQIISLFGNGSKLYYEFALRYFRIFLFFTMVNFMQPITSNFFTAIGKPKMGSFLALSRQIVFLLPLLLLLPIWMGIDGIIFAGPIADFMAAMLSFIMILRSFRKKDLTT